ncbi:MAG: bifunctional proline dehydrogenase/L-glutamate gamma-semialdehyde dehydrogenase PutA [Hyphomicrobiaceae bacterium]
MTGANEARRADRSSSPLSVLPSYEALPSYHLMAEPALLRELFDRAVLFGDDRRRVTALATRLVEATRAHPDREGGIEAFLGEYALSSEEGVILMCLAEALLRIPDADTADALIAEKIGGGRWERHLGHSDSLLVNASTWGLLLTGRIVKLGEGDEGAIGAMKRLVARSGETVIRQAVRQAMRFMGDQFVLGRTIAEALRRAGPLEAKGYRLSYDMLGEAARTRADAQRYFDSYAGAIEAIGKSVGPVRAAHADALMERPGVSVKLSALHPRFEAAREDVLPNELVPRLVELARLARTHGLTLTVDAEEQERLEVSLDTFGLAFLDPALAGWPGLGLAVQAYGKRALPTLRWLRRLSDQATKRIPLRLVKGAYWDSEIKWAQERGWSEYPVFTRKAHTDLSYLAAMRMVLSETGAFYAQLATHNAHTIAAASVMSAGGAFEYQRLHGMGEALYDAAAGVMPGRACRIYAPVGGHQDLLAYLVRRLLENGANTSFVKRLADDAAPVSEIVKDPLAIIEAGSTGTAGGQRASLPRPPEIFGARRRNSLGLPLSDRTARQALMDEIAGHVSRGSVAGPIIAGRSITSPERAEPVLCPHDRRERIGMVVAARDDEIELAVLTATSALHRWDVSGGEMRADVLDRAADLYERNRARFVGVMVREAGKTLENAQSDLREAVDFLRYYAAEARAKFAEPQVLEGPTGERNTLSLRARGPFACISPWNFPLAIFTGQVAAALAAGNTVLAKPAGQTPLTATIAVDLLHAAGVPGDVLHLLPGGGAVGAKLVGDPRVKGVAFTGSNETAWKIQQALAARHGEIVPFIAETGGLNAMIADSSALPEQVVRDAVRSAFDSAGQRCSAARVLFVQEDIAPRVLDMLAGAMDTLVVGDPLDYATDIGPVIDEAAQDALSAHKVRMLREGRRIRDLAMPEACRAGTYVTPAAFEIGNMGMLDREVFGPILHVVRFSGGYLDKVVAAINASGFGLTLGLHTRVSRVAAYVAEHARVGNLYVNRNQIGAVVGVQPFGGEGLSGTGPKAGGPHYLARFATERVRSDDITVTGGNVELLGLE